MIRDRLSQSPLLIKIDERLYDVLLHIVREVGVDGDGDGGRRSLFCYRKVAGLVAEMLEACLLVKGEWVVDIMSDGMVCEVCPEFVACIT